MSSSEDVARKEYILQLLKEAKASVRKDLMQTRFLHIRSLRQWKREDMMEQSNVRMREYDYNLECADGQLRELIEDCDAISDDILKASRMATESMESVVNEFKKASSAMCERVQGKVAELENEFEEDMRVNEANFLKQRTLLESLLQLTREEHSCCEVKEREKEAALCDEITERASMRDKLLEEKMDHQKSNIQELLEMHESETLEFCEPREKESKVLTEQMQLRENKMKDRINTIRRVSRDIKNLTVKRESLDTEELEFLKEEKRKLVAAANHMKMRIDKETRANSERLARLAVLYDKSKVKVERELELCESIERYISQLGSFPDLSQTCKVEASESNTGSPSEILDFQLAQHHIRVAQIELRNKQIEEENTDLRTSLKKLVRNNSVHETSVHQLVNALYFRNFRWYLNTSGISNSNFSGTIRESRPRPSHKLMLSAILNLSDSKSNRHNLLSHP